MPNLGAWKVVEYKIPNRDIIFKKKANLGIAYLDGASWYDYLWNLFLTILFAPEIILFILPH